MYADFSGSPAKQPLCAFGCGAPFNGCNSVDHDATAPPLILSKVVPHLLLSLPSCTSAKFSILNLRPTLIGGSKGQPGRAALLLFPFVAGCFFCRMQNK